MTFDFFALKIGHNGMH